MTMGQSPAGPLVEAYLADAPAPRRIALLIVARSSAVVLLALLAYSALPTRPETAFAVIVLTILGLVVVGVVFGRQLSRVSRAERPVLAAIEALTLVVTLFVVLFASLYVSMSAADEQAFTQPVGKVAGIYFAVTILGTVGFGDIAAVSEPARVMVTLQIVLDLILIGVAVKVLSTSARRAVEARVAARMGQPDPEPTSPREIADELVGEVVDDAARRREAGSTAPADGAPSRRDVG